MKTKKQLEIENKALREIITDIFWMARRYAHGRHTCAPSIIRDAYHAVKKMGIVIQHDITLRPPEPDEISPARFRDDWLDDCNA